MPRESTEPHGKDLRRGRVSLPGQVYHVTTVTLGRQPIFSDLRAARLLINALREAQVRGEATTLAFVIMPDHMHWLLQLAEETSLSGLVGAVKAVTAPWALVREGAAVRAWMVRARIEVGAWIDRA